MAIPYSVGNTYDLQILYALAVKYLVRGGDEVRVVSYAMPTLPIPNPE